METDYLLASAVLGKDAEEFLQTELGQFLIGRAEQEKQAALMQLATVDVNDANRIQKLQNHFYRADSFVGWLSELIQQGQQSFKILESQDHDR